MRKPLIVLSSFLAAGLAAAAVILGMPEPDTPETASVTNDFDSGASIEERLQALEAAINAEREVRQLLEDEILILYEVIEDLELTTAENPGRTAVSESDVAFRESRAALNRRRNDTGARLASLTDAGFSVDRASWVLQRESELQMEAMQTRYEAMRSGEAVGRFDPSMSPDSLLRAEIGDTEYEMYLAASNRQTSVSVRRVLDASPALSAGLLPGDRITHYGGERVFSTFDLTRQAIQGEAGENVVVNIVRDGAPMQVVLPRGPLGISTSRGR